MPVKPLKGKVRDRYFELIQEYPLRHINSLEELKSASAMLDTLLVKPSLSAGEREYFEVLLDLIHTYEQKAYPPRKVTDAGMLEHLLDAQGLTQGGVLARRGHSDQRGQRDPQRQAEVESAAHRKDRQAPENLAGGCFFPAIDELSFFNHTYSTPFVLGTPFCRGIDFHGSAERAGGGLENAFGDVVAVAAVVEDDVQVAQRVGREGLPEIEDQFAVEVADFRRGEVGLEDEVRPAAEVDGRGDERFFHRQREMPVTSDAGLIAQGLLHRLAQANPHVFDGVMLIDVQIADGLQLQVDHRVFGQERQRMVEEAHARSRFPPRRSHPIPVRVGCRSRRVFR